MHCVAVSACKSVLSFNVPNINKHALVLWFAKKGHASTYVQEAARQQVHKQEAAISRLHQRSRECFRHLKSGQSAHPLKQTHILSQEETCLAQPVLPIAQDRSADVRSVEGMQGVQMAQQGQEDGSALESQHRQQRSASPVRGTALLAFLTRTCMLSWTEPRGCSHMPAVLVNWQFSTSSYHPHVARTFLSPSIAPAT